MNFVEGSLLDLNIRPLELGEPNFEECLKQECTMNCGCSQVVVATDRTTELTGEE